MDDSTHEDEQTWDEAANDLDHALARGVEGDEDSAEVRVTADAGGVLDGPFNLEEELAHEGGKLRVGVGA